MSERPFLGLRTVIYHVPDLARARSWYASAFATEPYFDEPFYVGFSIGGYELGLDPDLSSVPNGAAGAVAYWGVSNAETAFDRLLSLGAKAVSRVKDVGEGIKVASVRDPFGNVIGIIENPHFRVGETT